MEKLLQQLTEIPSPSGDEARLGTFLAGHLERIGLQVQRQAVGERRFNLVATTQKAPTVLLCTHMDTVEPFLPFRREANRFFGRGVCDAKGILVSMVSAAEQLLQNEVLNFGLLFVVGEETTSDGAKLAAHLKLDSRFVIVGEPTRNRLASAQKGTLVFRIRVHGRSGHSAYPEQGDSAIHRLVELLEKLRAADWGSDATLGRTTLNIGLISGGSAPNVIAGQAEATGIFRIAAALDSVINKLQEFESDGAVEIDILNSSEPQTFLHPEGFETTVVHFGSDAPFLRPFGQVLLAGPGSIEYAHSPQEQITIEELREGQDLYIRLVKTLLES